MRLCNCILLSVYFLAWYLLMTLPPLSLTTPPPPDYSLNSCLTSTPLLIQPVSEAARTATPPTIHPPYSQPPQPTPCPTPSTHVPQNPPSVTPHTTAQHPSLLEAKHPSPPTHPDLHVELATVTTPPHSLAQENTGMDQVVLMIAVECMHVTVNC